ncbi:Clo7bot family Cys-rich peptide [Paraclostridium ghonii]|uniref:Cys-rich peptide (Clo7bot family) n=1 Tax=Paraclostridium ghonii TaxID=29358 RepID=A0ABU0N5K5_9FIRM|nr:Clo7bot family Cys-rich peptide [Paeniclostridium ghonii]MDQ0557976.1 Cys-rich peptide (Clo7bot family) [Paeniclostridium ghonii]
MKFIKKPLTKFNEGYCFCSQCIGKCGSNSGCVKFIQNV